MVSDSRNQLSNNDTNGSNVKCWTLLPSIIIHVGENICSSTNFVVSTHTGGIDFSLLSNVLPDACLPVLTILAYRYRYMNSNLFESIFRLMKG